MFAALAKLLGRKPPVNRRLFEFFDGQKKRAVDPWRVLRAISTHPTVHFDNSLAMAQLGQEPETSDLFNAVAEIFAIARYNESQCPTGLTDIEIMDLLESFYEYVGQLKKNSSPGPILSEPTASESSTSPALQPATTS